MTRDTHCIYVLKDESSAVFYVGKTSTPQKRFKRHVAHVKYGSHYPVHNKLRKVISAKGNTDDIYEIIESNILQGKIDEREIFFIKFYKSQGCKLKNLTDGGEGGKGFTPEINKRGALKRTGIPRPRLTRQRISEAKKGIPLSSEHKKALCKAWEKRAPLPLEHYQKISSMNRGVVNIKNYILCAPNGNFHTTTHGLSEFCRQHCLDVRNLVSTRPGGSRKHHKGWRIHSEC